MDPSMRHDNDEKPKANPKEPHNPNSESPHTTDLASFTKMSKEPHNFSVRHDNDEKPKANPKEPHNPNSQPPHTTDLASFTKMSKEPHNFSTRHNNDEKPKANPKEPHNPNSQPPHTADLASFTKMSKEPHNFSMRHDNDEKLKANPKEPHNPNSQPPHTTDLASSLKMSNKPSDATRDCVPPPRPVYKDLTTAHSSITSGSGRSRSRSLSTAAVDELTEMHNLETAAATPEATTKAKVLPALPVLVSREKYNLHPGVFFEKPKDNLDMSDYGRVERKTGTPLNTWEALQGVEIPDPLFTAPKIPLETKPIRWKPWPRDSLDLNRSDSEQKQTQTEQVQYYQAQGMSPQTLPQDVSEGNDHLSTGSHSLPDSSTIDKIVGTYVHSDGTTDSESFGGNCRAPANAAEPASGVRRNVSRDAIDTNAVKPRRGRRYAHKASGNPPNIALPTAPGLPVTPLATSSSANINPSTSYGDTRNLLEITPKSYQPVKPSGLNHEYFRQNLTAGERGECSNAATAASSLYRTISTEDSDHFEYDDGQFGGTRRGRLPLERDVSKALRRESALSDESGGTITSSILNPPNISQSKPAGSRRGSGLRATSVRERESFPIRFKDSSFYDNGALDQDWVNAAEHNNVRVPVIGSGLKVTSQPDSLNHANLQPYVEDCKDDADDWETDRDTRGYTETVAESGFGLDMRGDSGGMLGGTVRQTGDSIADMSDRDAASFRTVSTFPRNYEGSHYGSTERIAHHPAPMAYSGLYRQGEVKKTNIPVMMPSYQQHKVNGYFSDSNRLRPRQLFNHVQKRLDKAHPNPFQSSPPEVLSTKTGILGNEPKKDLGKLFSRSRSKGKRRVQSSLPDEVGIPLEPVSSFKPISNPKFGDKLQDWIPDQYGEPYGSPGPALRSSGQIETPSQKDEFVDVDLQDRTSSQYVGNQAMGNSVSSTGPGDTSADGFVRTPVVGGRPGRDNPNHCSPYTRDPSGTSYNRTESALANRESRHQMDILEALRSTPPPQNRDTTKQAIFSYRSPLAPPRDKIWNRLYTGSQVIRMEEASEPAIRTLNEHPRVFPRNDRPISKRLTTRMNTVSYVVLGFCNFFPPLLICFRTGKLDSIMVWLTNGEVTAYSETSQKACPYMIGFWIGVLLFFLGFLLYSKLHNG
ncbi:hypothetical protein BP6252_07011 [Coleophoma cylindrospora]|uniref:Uncharacterized protein n=1 Tax=Coleophoma cylindrospora TaxID=1849047 RepID=A0A3D8RGV6_9HELO|nr:hypothetical protein BP6252_07011 [Coleophoma cylindrospora]